MAFISFVVREQSSVHDAIYYDDQDQGFVSYIGSMPIAFERLGKMQPNLPPRWQGCIRRCDKLKPRQLVGKYTSYRYLIHFDQNNAVQATQLLFGDGRNPAASELASSIVGNPMTANIRSNRFTSVSPIDFAMIAVTDVIDQIGEGSEEKPSSTLLTPQDATRLATIIRKDTKQDGGLMFPSQHINLVFSLGGVVGTPSEFAVVGRFMSAKEKQNETLVPMAVIDWLNFVDQTQVISDLTQELGKTELGTASITDYIDQVLAAHGEAEFEARYLKPREVSLARRIEFTEFTDELARSLRGNVFGESEPPYFRELNIKPNLPGVDFAESVSSAFTVAAKKFDLVQSRIKSRDERLSEYLRDVVGWRVTQASNHLAKRMETLTKWLLLLAVLTVLAALPTDEIKKEVYRWLHELWAKVGDGVTR